jgi:hypothetical protein
MVALADSIIDEFRNRSRCHGDLHPGIKQTLKEKEYEELLQL